MTTRLAEFEAAVRETTASATRTSPGGFPAALREAVDGDAVGAPLPFEAVSLDAASVNTDPTRGELLAADTGVTGATLGIAEYGSVVLRSTDGLTEHASLFPERHVVVVREADLVADMPAAFDRLAPILADERADAIVATGPSATADMGELVYGAHGPRDVHVLVVESVDDDVEGE